MKIFREDFEVDVDPEVANWLIKISGYTVTELSNKTKIKKERLERWINGKVRLKFSEIEKISKVIKRPLTAFLLLKPLKEMKLPEDYRLLPIKKGEFQPKTISLLYKAREIQELAKELAENINFDLHPKFEFISNIFLYSPEEIARKYREEFGFNEKLQLQMKNPKELFNFLREKLEEKNVLILQLPIPIEDARGFALADVLPYTIVVSTEDNLKARNFTLMHEFAHLISRISVIDSPLESLYFLQQNKKYKIEEWCNDFASEFLLPRKILIREYKKYKGKITEEILTKLSNKYKVSKEMLVYKMKKLKLISLDLYKKYKDRVVKRKKGIYRSKERPSYLEIIINQHGKLFVELVIRNEEAGIITYSDALNYLSITSKTYEKLVSKQ